MNKTLVNAGVALACFVALYCLYTFLNRDKHGVTSYKGCAASFVYFRGNVQGTDTSNEQFDFAKRKVALCLCDKYAKSKDSSLLKYILMLHDKYGNSSYVGYDKRSLEDLPNEKRINTILKYRREIFDTVAYEY